MKRILFFLMLTAPVLVNAKPASELAWTPDQLSFVKHGDSNKGKELATAKACTGCHGDTGISTTPETPSLAGQVATYLYKQLRDYAKESRQHDFMSPVAAGLSEQDAADLATWYASLPLPVNKSGGQNLAKIEKMVEQGDGKRILPPCEVCHGGNGQGEKMDIPALKGQQADYFTKTLLDYKNGKRHNDIYSRMRLIAEQLSDDEIKDLAAYYQNLQ